MKLITIKKFFILAIFALLSSAVHAQVFTPIVGDYQCGQFPNGSQFLVKKTNTGFILVNSKIVKETFNKERRILRQRIKTLNTLLKGFKQSRIAFSKLLKGANSILKKVFGEDAIPSQLPVGEAEIAIFQLKQRLADRDASLATIGNLIKDCENGINPKKGKGSPISVSVEAISLASSREIFGGFVIYSSKLKTQFSRKPGGYNVCLKLIFADGSANSFYTGFGDDFLCGTGTSKFEGIPQSECNKVMPRNQVGYVIQKRQYAFTSLPDATTQQLLDRMRLEVLQDPPLVGVLAFTDNISRNSSLKACEAF